MAAILVADSKVHVRGTLQSRLQLEGHVVAVAGSDDETVARLKTWNFDLVVIDNALLSGSHFDSIGMLMQKSPSTKVIVMSHGEADVELEQTLDIVEVAGRLYKPISYGQLDRVIERVLA